MTQRGGATRASPRGRPSVARELRFNRVKGVLTFRGQRYLLMRPDTVRAFCAEMRRATPRAAEAMFKGGFRGGRASASRWLREFGLEPAAMVRRMCAMGAELGWGALRPVVVSGNRVVIEVEESAFAEPGAGRATCDLIRGVVGGIAAELFREEDVRARETRCASAGARRCRFEARRGVGR